MTDWVELRRYDDDLEAEIALNFLRDHGIPVKLHGNSGQTSVLNRFSTIVDIRLMVPKKSIKRARGTLDAMTDADVERMPEAEEEDGAGGHPYRGEHGKKEEPRPRYRRAALVLSFLLPIGSGHIYSRHDVTGGVIAIGMVALLIGSVVAGAAWLLGACFALAFLDAVFAMRAVREHNEGTIPESHVQIRRGLGFVALAVALAFAAHAVA